MQLKYRAGMEAKQKSADLPLPATSPKSSRETSKHPEASKDIISVYIYSIYRLVYFQSVWFNFLDQKSKRVHQF